MKSVLLLNKHIGETPLACLERFKFSHPEYADQSLTYAGRLDPMAEGLLLVLVGDEVHKKDVYLEMPKTYQFEILWGFEADTFDALGLITNSSDKTPAVREVETALQSFVGKRVQEYPSYSSKTVEGKPLFVWAREGKIGTIKKPSREVDIFDLKLVGTREVGGQELKDGIFKKIENVSGDFRQEEIMQGWNEVIDLKKKYHISQCEMKCSSGTYVRALAQELGHYFGSFAIALHIKRLSIGHFSIEESCG